MRVEKQFGIVQIEKAFITPIMAVNMTKSMVVNTHIDFPPSLQIQESQNFGLQPHRLQLHALDMCHAHGIRRSECWRSQTRCKDNQRERWKWKGLSAQSISYPYRRVSQQANTTKKHNGMGNNWALLLSQKF